MCRRVTVLETFRNVYLRPHQSVQGILVTGSQIDEVVENPAMLRNIMLNDHIDERCQYGGE
jgi:hypothetical protein